MQDLGKVGFVFSGGAIHGVFQAEALRVIREEAGIKPDYILGMSAGSLNGAAACCGKQNELLRVWQNIKRGDIFRIPILDRFWGPGHIGTSSLLDHSPLLDLMVRFTPAGTRKNMKQAEKEQAVGELLIAAPTTFAVLATNLQRLRPEIFTNRDENIINNPALLTKAIMASCAVPTLFPPIEINGYQYVDGEIKLDNPFEHPVKEGCNTIFFFYTPVSHANERKQYRTFFGIGLRVIEMNMYQCHEPQGLLEEALEEYGRTGQTARMVTIMPDKPLPQMPISMRMTFSKKKIQQYIAEGRRCARNALQASGLLP